MYRVVAFLGLLLVLAILWDAFETIILPRRVTRRLRITSLFYRSVWWPWSGLTRRLTSGKQREKYLGLFDGSPPWQARLTFAMARHAIVDIAQVFRTAPRRRHAFKGRLSPADFQRMVSIVEPDQGWTEDIANAEQRLTEIREMYEPYIAALSEYLVMPLPPWILSEKAIDNWKTSAWGRIQ